MSRAAAAAAARGGVDRSDPDGGRAGPVAEADRPAAPPAYEPTEAGPQALIAGVAPIRLADRLALFAAAPLAPRRPQQPCDLGLFDGHARNQLDLFAKLPPGRPDG